MKRIIKKRLMYRHMGTNEIFYGGEEFDEHLTNESILGATFELGKHEWCPHCLALYQLNNKGELVYQIAIEEFAQYQKSWYNLVWDWARRNIWKR